MSSHWSLHCTMEKCKNKFSNYPSLHYLMKEDRVKGFCRVFLVLTFAPAVISTASAISSWEIWHVSSSSSPSRYLKAKHLVTYYINYGLGATLASPQGFGSRYRNVNLGNTYPASSGRRRSKRAACFWDISDAFSAEDIIFFSLYCECLGWEKE